MPVQMGSYSMPLLKSVIKSSESAIAAAEDAMEAAKYSMVTAEAARDLARLVLREAVEAVEALRQHGSQGSEITAVIGEEVRDKIYDTSVENFHNKEDVESDKDTRAQPREDSEGSPVILSDPKAIVVDVESDSDSDAADVIVDVETDDSSDEDGDHSKNSNPIQPKQYWIAGSIISKLGRNIDHNKNGVIIDV